MIYSKCANCKTNISKDSVSSIIGFCKDCNYNNNNFSCHLCNHSATPLGCHPAKCLSFHERFNLKMKQVPDLECYYCSNPDSETYCIWKKEYPNQETVHTSSNYWIGFPVPGPRLEVDYEVQPVKYYKEDAECACGIHPSNCDFHN